MSTVACFYVSTNRSKNKQQKGANNNNENPFQRLFDDYPTADDCPTTVQLYFPMTSDEFHDCLMTVKVNDCIVQKLSNDCSTTVR